MIAYTDIVKMTVPCEEYTMPKYEFNTGGEFVALQLILDWGRAGHVGMQSALLKKDV